MTPFGNSFNESPSQEDTQSYESAPKEGAPCSLGMHGNVELHGVYRRDEKTGELYCRALEP